MSFNFVHHSLYNNLSSEATKVARVTDLDRFETLLPANIKKEGHVDEETRETLLRYYVQQLANVSTECDAMLVFTMAIDHIKSTTRRQYEDTADLLLGGVFDVSLDSTRAILYRASDIKTMKPCLIKFGPRDDVIREADVYKRLSGSNLNYVPNEIVSIEYRQTSLNATIDKSIGLKMPVFVQSLASLSNNQSEEAVHTRVSTDILPALLYMHTLNIYHMDVKRENIMIDHHGHWFLGDFGSCVSKAGDKTNTTASKKPFDLRATPPSARYDKILLAVACMDLTQGFLSKSSGFSMADLQWTVEELKNEDFKAFVRSLIE